MIDDLVELSGALRRLTNRIMHGETALWRRDRAKIDRLAERFPAIRNSHIDKISRIYWLIEDCKRYGTLPFAGLARAGFIAVQMLQSLVDVGVLSAEEGAAFMASVDTVGSRNGRDFALLPRADFLQRAMGTSGREPTTSCRRATTKRPISISTGRPPGPHRPRRRASRSPSSSCAASSNCSKSTSSQSTS